MVDTVTQRIIKQVIKLLFTELGGSDSVAAREAIAYYYGCDRCGNFPGNK